MRHNVQYVILHFLILLMMQQVRSERCSLHAVALLDPIWIDKWHQNFPAHWKVGPAPVFWASRPLEPTEWLALLILKAGDVENNPGPQNRKLPPSALTTKTTTLNSTTHSHATTSHHNQKLLALLQLNINSITNKHEELKLLVTELQPDIITIQETKLKKHNKTPQIPTYSAIRTDRANANTQHGFKAKHSTTTALHNINNTIAAGFNQRIPPARTIAVAQDMSKAFDTLNILTLTKKLLDTQIPPILIKFIANYIKGRKAFTTYNNKTSTQRQFKTGVPQGGVLSPTLFNIYTSDIPSPPPNINITVYADDITMTSTDTNK